MVGGAVFITPYDGARALLEWAVDLWPYVNGKAIMSSVNLGELDSKDMLDVIHFILEEDLLASTEEEVHYKSSSRKLIYEQFYEEEYKYERKVAQSKGSTTASGEIINDDDLVPFDPTVKNVRKPYVRPTDFDPNSNKPFGDVLDGPIA
jgi:hypothetical protein